MAFINEATCFSGQIEDLLISEGPEPLTDHASLTLPFYPITGITLLPPPAPKGYNVDAARQEAWTTAFLAELRSKGTADDLNTAISDLNEAIENASKNTLEPRRAPNPKGASWWNKACTKAQTAARTATLGPGRKAANKNLQHVIVNAKRDWAHEKLDHAVDAGDIWALAKLRKGRQTNAFPPLRTPDNQLIDDPDDKAKIFQDKFFPANPVTVDASQLDNPPPTIPRHWTPITTLEVTNTLKTTTNSSAPGPSGVGYNILKWAHVASPEVLTHIFNMSLFTGTHPWKHATVVILNKPNKPNYSQAKAYRPISLLECSAKLMEKIIAKRVNDDISRANLLSMLQFGSRPHHNAIDAIATLVHCIQATRLTGHAGALLLFDIAGFFNTVNPDRVTQIFRLKGFPTYICDWIHSFLTGRMVSLKMGTHISAPCDIHNGTPQGLPLSPILSAVYTAFLLDMSSWWSHKDLTMYVNDGAIYVVSATTQAAVTSALMGYKEVLCWLASNGLSADLAKTELIMFMKPRANIDLTGGRIWGGCYADAQAKHLNITTATTVKYLGMYISHDLK